MSRERLRSAICQPMVVNRMKARIGLATRSRKRRYCCPPWQKEWQRCQRLIEHRLDKQHREPNDGLSVEQPELQGANVRCEMGERQCGTADGAAAAHQLMRELGLAQVIDNCLLLLKWHKPNRELNHVLNFALNALRAGECLDFMKLCREEAAYLGGLGAWRTPDPTTAGNFCRRFKDQDVRILMRASARGWPNVPKRRRAIPCSAWAINAQPP